MITELASGYAAAKHALTVAKGIAELKTQVEINNAVFEIQQHLLDVQQQLSDAQRKYDELLELKKQSDAALKARDDWDAEAARYKLHEIAKGIFVYVLAQPGTGPEHWLCANCFQNRRKSIFQKKFVDRKTHTCPGCSFEINPVPTDFSVLDAGLRRRGSGLDYNV